MSKWMMARGGRSFPSLLVIPPALLVGVAPGAVGRLGVIARVVVAALLLFLVLLLGWGRRLLGRRAHRAGRDAAEDVGRADREAQVLVDRAARDLVDGDAGGVEIAAAAV